MNEIIYECPGDEILHFIYKLITDDALVVPSSNSWTVTLGGVPITTYDGEFLDYVYSELGDYLVEVEMFDDTDTSLGTISFTHVVRTPLKALFSLTMLDGDDFVFRSVSTGFPDTFNWFLNGTPAANTDELATTLTDVQITVLLVVERILDGASDTVEFTYSIGTIACDDKYKMLFYKKDCHSYIVKDDRTVNRLIILSDFKGNIISSEPVGPAEVEIPLITPNDGVYEVEIRNVDDPNDSSIFVPIYDTCDTEECYYKLVTQVQCNSECIDCSDEDVVRVEKTREALNRMTGLMFFLEKYIKIETDTYLGLTTINADRNSAIAKVDLVMQRLAITMNDCTDCFSDIGIDDNCQNC